MLGVALCLIIGSFSVLIFIEKISQAAMYAYDVCTLKQRVIIYKSGDAIYDQWGVGHLLSDPRTDSSVNLYVGKRDKVGIGIMRKCDFKGSSCNGTHLHLSLKINGEYVDPLDTTKNYNINGC
jgi:hypothetical protein